MCLFEMRSFMMRLFAICTAVLAFIGGLRIASAELMYNFQVGTWLGGAIPSRIPGSSIIAPRRPIITAAF
jgi:hypothetical protein